MHLNEQKQNIVFRILGQNVLHSTAFKVLNLLVAFHDGIIDEISLSAFVPFRTLSRGKYSEDCNLIELARP